MSGAAQNASFTGELELPAQRFPSRPAARRSRGLASLKSHLQAELQLTWIDPRPRRGNESESRGAERSVGRRKIGVIEDVENVGFESQLHTLGQVEALDQRQVIIFQVR